MKIGFCYDTTKEYEGLEINPEYSDFIFLQTVSEIGKAIEQNGYQVKYIGDIYKLQNQLSQHTFDCDLVFNIAESFSSKRRKAILPSLLELYHIPHTGSDSNSMSLNSNKHCIKIFASSLGIPVPKGICFGQLSDKVIADVSELQFPIILKPNCGDGSMGVFLIDSLEEFKKKSEFLLCKYSFELIAEEYIEGAEVTVPIIGNGTQAKALGVVTILNQDGTNISVYDSALKSAGNVTNSMAFAYGDSVKETIMDYSIAIHNFCHICDYSQIDFRVTPEGKPYFLEIDAMPSLNPEGTFAQSSRDKGMAYHQLIGEIIGVTKKRYCWPG